MGLTPIHIPGKRKRETTKAAIEGRKALKRKPGRPLKLPAAGNETNVPSEGSELIKKPKKRSLKSMKSRRKMSDLEKLPIELLEKVFLYCLNLNLPGSSPIIAAKLSSPIVFNHTVMAAFGPTWHDFMSSEQPLVEEVEEVEDVDLQSAVLRCRWATLPLLLKGKDTWISQHAKNRAFNPIYFMESALKPPLPSRMTASEYFEADFMTFVAFVTQARKGEFCEDIKWDTNKDLAKSVEIPHNLLRGPWSEEKVRYLYWIVKSGGHIDWHSSTNGEVALEGLKDAIQEGNVAAIHILGWAGLVEKLDIETLIFAIRNAGGDKFTTVNQLLKVGFDSISSKDARKLRTVLLDMMDEAELDEDEEKLGLVNAMLDSPTLKLTLKFI